MRIEMNHRNPYNVLLNLATGFATAGTIFRIIDGRVDRFLLAVAMALLIASLLGMLHQGLENARFRRELREAIAKGDILYSPNDERGGL